MTETDPAAAGAEAVRPPPPPGRRWSPGQSGNPAGGPRRPAPRTAEVEWVFSQSFTVEIDGEKQRLPLARALLLALAHRALNGDAKATTELLGLMGDAEKVRLAEAAARAKKASERRAEREERLKVAATVDSRHPNDLPRLAAMIDRADRENATEEALALLDCVTQDEGGAYRLKPWVAEAAEAARPGLWDGLTWAERSRIEDALIEADEPP